jgi:hypothetical protein
LIEEAHRLPHRTMLARAVLEPILAAIAVEIFGMDAFGRIPVGTLPSEGLAEAGADLREAVV